MLIGVVGVLTFGRSGPSFLMLDDCCRLKERWVWIYEQNIMHVVELSSRALDAMFDDVDQAKWNDVGSVSGWSDGLIEAETL